MILLWKEHKKEKEIMTNFTNLYDKYAIKMMDFISNLGSR